MTDSSQAPTLLNVDDFEPGRYAKTRLLQQNGWRVIEAGTGSDALVAVRRERPALVILDVHLPDMNGLEVCRQIKADPNTASTLVLQISATYITAADWAEALETGADAYLTEPFDPPVLLATVRALLRTAAAERALQQANAELRRSNEDLARFAYVASHDLQEPLRTVTNFSQLFVRRYGGQLGEDADLFIRYIVEGTKRMSDLIRDLLLYSQAGVKRRADPVDLGQVLDSTLNSLAALIAETGAQVTSDKLPVLSGDSHQIAHLLQNLLSNSIRYRSDQAPRIHISVEPLNGKWLFSVRDNGIGFLPEYAKHIFEPFRRLDRNVSAGTGVGLAIAKRVVENHGGEIWAESEPGRGSTFYFTLSEESASSDSARSGA